MRFLYLALILLLCTCVRAQEIPPGPWGSIGPVGAPGPTGCPPGHQGEPPAQTDPPCHLLTPANQQAPPPFTPEELAAAMANTDTLLPTVYLEIDYDVVLQKGGVAQAEAYARAYFAEEVRLFERDATIQPQLILFVHDAPSGYLSESSIESLYEFRDARPDHPGHVAQLASYRASGGVAWVPGTCSDYNYSFASIQPTFRAIEEYSWTINVSAHELGHNFGSNHTQACIWNGNDTPIDGCVPPEGACAQPMLPDTGSLMSYCHLQGTVANSVRILPQPAAVMRAHLLATGCVPTKPAQPTGPQPCLNTEITLALLTDLHPRETAWAITNEDGATVATSRPYAKSEYLLRLDTTACLPDGCYQLTVTDPDGLESPDYGLGFFAVLNGPDTLAYVAAFSGTALREFCIGILPADCDPIALTNFEPYGGNQDNGTGELSFNDTRLTLTGNAWKSIPREYDITESTILDLQMKSPSPGEIIGVGLDDNHVLSSNRTFRLGGSQAWGISSYAVYPQQGGGWMRVSLPIGQYYTGPADRLFFVNDKDWGTADNEATFRDLILHEGQCGPATMPDLGAVAGAKQVVKSGAAFTADVATDWMLSDMAGRILLRGHVNAGASVYFNESGVPLGIYTISWMSDEGPMAEKLFVGPRLR